MLRIGEFSKLSRISVRMLRHYDNDYRIAKSIEDSIDFAAKRQVWQRMIHGIIRPMLTAMMKRKNSRAVLPRCKAARRKAFLLFAIISSLSELHR